MSHQPTIVCCGSTPALQRNLVFPDWEVEGDVVRSLAVQESASGKATNAARAIRMMGGDPILLGFCGGSHGQRMEALVEADGIRASWIHTEAETRVCQTLLDQQRGRIRELVEEALPVSGRDWDALFRRTEELLSGGDTLCLCGSLPRESDPGILAQLARLAAQQDARIVMDAVGLPLLQALEEDPWLVKINRQELQRSTRLADAAEGIAALRDQGARAVLITDGPNPAQFAGPEGCWTLTLPPIAPHNPIGSGDTVTGVLAWTSASADAISVEAVCLALGAGLAQAETDLPARFQVERAWELGANIQVD